jgi:hypothetical protein
VGAPFARRILPVPAKRYGDTSADRYGLCQASGSRVEENMAGDRFGLRNFQSKTASLDPNGLHIAVGTIDEISVRCSENDTYAPWTRKFGLREHLPREQVVNLEKIY